MSERVRLTESREYDRRVNAAKFFRTSYDGAGQCGCCVALSRAVPRRGPVATVALVRVVLGVVMTLGKPRCAHHARNFPPLSASRVLREPRGTDA